MRLQKSFLYYPENDFVYNGFSLVHWTLPLESQKSAAFMVLFIGPPVDQNIRLPSHFRAHPGVFSHECPESRVCHRNCSADVSRFAPAINHYYLRQHFNDLGHLHTRTPVYSWGGQGGVADLLTVPAKL